MFSILVTSVAAVWLTIEWSLRRRLKSLDCVLPAAFTRELNVRPEEQEDGQFLRLAVDLLRKTPCSDPFDSLSAHEQEFLRYAHAIQQLPSLLHPFVMMRLGRSERRLLRQLQAIKSSQPNHVKPHFGALGVLQNARNARNG